MSDISVTQASPSPEPRPLERADIAVALGKGWADFRRAPLLGLVFGGVYIVFGLIVIGLILATGQTFYAIPVTLGFPLVAPFAAVGLYEISRRIEVGDPLEPGAIFGLVFRQRNGQLPWFGAIMVVWFLFYLFLSHVLFALVMGPSAMVNVFSSYEMFLSAKGLTMIAGQIVVGGLFAFTIFAICVIGVPLMMERDVDYVTAGVTSIRAVLASPGPMLAWAVTIVVLLGLAVIPAFFGLFVVLPVLGHATWHIYRKVLPV